MSESTARCPRCFRSKSHTKRCILCYACKKEICEECAPKSKCRDEGCYGCDEWNTICGKSFCPPCMEYHLRPHRADLGY